MIKPKPARNTSENIWRLVDASGDCWEWIGNISYGYGRTSYEGSDWQAHRLVWTLLVGPIPDGLTIDHLCRNKPCVNPDHLEPVTQAENLYRGYSPSAQLARQHRTHCINGHALTPDNLYTKRGWRECLFCRRQRSRDSARRLKTRQP